MDYNSQRRKLLLPEYGRNVQNMVDHMNSIPDKDKRTRCAYAIVSVMGNMFPMLRDMSEFQQKLWDHITIMSNYNIDIDSPVPLPTREMMEVKHKRLPYPNEHIKIKHYGKNIEELIKVALELDDEFMKKQMVLLLSNHMKKLFLSWNKDVVNDEKIFDDLRLLSKGMLDYNSSDFKLLETKAVVKQKKKKNPNKLS
jgi:hypothetical protein